MPDQTLQPSQSVNVALSIHISEVGVFGIHYMIVFRGVSLNNLILRPFLTPSSV